MARDPDITLNVTTDQAVKNLTGLEAAAVDAEGKVEKLDGQTISIDPKDTTRAIDDLGKKLDDANAKANKVGKDGIPVTTNAFKDLSGAVGTQTTGALGSAFAFGEGLEGLGDLVEGFGGKLGLSEDQIGKVTTALGTTLGVLGAVGVAFAVGKAAFDVFSSGARKAEEDQKKFNDEVDKSEQKLRGVAEALAAGEKAKAFRDIAKDIEPLLQGIAEQGLDAADAIREIAGGGTPFTDRASRVIATIEGNIRDLQDRRTTAFDEELVQINDRIREYGKEKSALEKVVEQIVIRREGVKGATEIDRLAAIALGDLNTAITDQTEYLKENAQKIEDRRQKQLDAIDTERDLEMKLLDTKDALKQYDEKMQDANGNVDAQRRITIETAQQVIELAKSWGMLAGPDGSVDNINRTRESLQFLYADLAPGSPLRTEIQKTIEDLARIGVGFQTGGPITGAALGAKEGGIGRSTTTNTINVTVTSADPNAVVRALQTYVRQNGALPPSIR